MTLTSDPFGRDVWYRSKTGRYTLPAKVSCSQKFLFRPAVDGKHIPDLDSSEHVHLTVFTAGFVGHRLPETDPTIVAEAAGGSYQEHNIPYWEPVGVEGDRFHAGDHDAQPAGTWTWPRRT